jgi:hypothetical protein
LRTTAALYCSIFSRLYRQAAYNEEDQKYIAKQFWDQRWTQWGYAAGNVALEVLPWALVPCVLLFILGYSALDYSRV